MGLVTMETRVARFQHLVAMVTVLYSLVPAGHTLCTVQLVHTVYSVREGEQLVMDVRKTGTAASPVNVVIEVSE